MSKMNVFSFIQNSENRVDANKSLAFIGAIVGAIILIIATFKNYEGLEWLLTVYMVSTMGQLPSKGLNDLSRMKIEKNAKD